MSNYAWKMALVFIFFFVVPVEAQDSQRLRTIFPNGVPGFFRFRMFNECRPVNLHVSVATYGHKEPIEDNIRSMVEGRLRAAGILSDALVSTAELNVDVFAMLGSFAVRVDFEKSLYDPTTDMTLTTPTRSFIDDGTYNEVSDFLQPLSEAIDTFIDDYLYVNEGSC